MQLAHVTFASSNNVIGNDFTVDGSNFSSPGEFVGRKVLPSCRPHEDECFLLLNQEEFDLGQLESDTTKVTNS